MSRISIYRDSTPTLVSESYYVVPCWSKIPWLPHESGQSTRGRGSLQLTAEVGMNVQYMARDHVAWEEFCLTI